MPRSSTCRCNDARRRGGAGLNATSAEAAFGPIRELADEHTLSVYDATYLELALRLGAPLASHDDRLRKAAKARGALFESPV